jgi:hypothetical protein
MSMPAEVPLPTYPGVAATTTLRPVPAEVVPLAAAQGTLPLRLDNAPGLPRRPELSVVSGGNGDVEAFAARFAQAVVEVIGGDRGVHQLMRWTTETVYTDLLRRTNELQRLVPGELRTRRARAQVRSVHLFRPRPGVAELSVHVRHGQRSRALAARLEVLEGRWRCSVLQFG